MTGENAAEFARLKMRTESAGSKESVVATSAAEDSGLLIFCNISIMTVGNEGSSYPLSIFFSFTFGSNLFLKNENIDIFSYLLFAAFYNVIVYSARRAILFPKMDNKPPNSSQFPGVSDSYVR